MNRRSSFFTIYALCCSILFITCTKEEPVLIEPPVYVTGLPEEMPEEYDTLATASFPPMGNLPAMHILDMPPAGNQGSQGSCTAWAVAYGMKGYQRKIGTGLPYVSGGVVNSTVVGSPAFVYNQVKSGGDCLKGTQITSALKLLRDKGVCPLESMTYSDSDCTLLPDANQFAIAAKNRISTYKKLPADVSSIKEALFHEMPVVIGVYIRDKSFENMPHSDDFVWNTNNSTGASIHHAMVIYGYDDSRQAFKILNSWGKGWGSNGSFWMGYTVVPQLIRQAYVAEDAGVYACPKVISLSGDLQFGTVTVKPVPAPSRVLTIKNQGTCPLTIQSVGFPDHFSTSFSGPTAIAPNAKLDVTITFDPQSAGIFAGQVTVQSDATSGTATINLSGTATSAGTGILTLSDDLDFGDIVLGEPTSAGMTVTNTGTSALTVTQVTSGNSNFVLNGLPGLPKVLQPNQSFSCNVYLTAQNVGLHSGSITVQSSVGNKSILVVGNVSPSQQSCPATFTDIRDGEVYAAVEFAGKCWMKENLRFDSPNAGDDTPYQNNPALLATYGRYYTWLVLMNGESASNQDPSGVKGLCPQGWHVPSGAEWQTLLDYYGGDTFLAYASLIEGGSSGLDFQLTGKWSPGILSWNGLGVKAWYWSSSQFVGGEYRTAEFNNSIQNQFSTGSVSGNNRLPCRCVQD